ncbi:Mpv17/PMP22 family protein [Coniella lustricola]|uniref:Mpv17/PMP22 family protein n=1 Tax=Coniella lustricola TaxID=2025994 RepID=A0A2T3A725_9PEZI|nr:Mpv17/PMP22 family protein [Coniella lustricola]
MGPLLSTAIRALFLKAGANVTAQLIARWHSQDPIPPVFDRQRVLEFAIYGFFQAQLGFFWHVFLERVFPSRHESRLSTEGTSINLLEVLNASRQGVNWWNVIAKLVLDQTLGMFCFLSIFLTWTNLFRVQRLAEIPVIWRSKIFTLIYASWGFWPWIMVLNFVLVPVEKRQLVSVCVGFCWNIILSLLTHPEPPQKHD